MRKTSILRKYQLFAFERIKPFVLRLHDGINGAGNVDVSEAIALANIILGE